MRDTANYRSVRESVMEKLIKTADDSDMWSIGLRESDI